MRAGVLASVDAATHLVRMSQQLPSTAETVSLPMIGTVLLYCEGAVWRAVRPDYEQRPSSPAGLGASPGEAIAELVAQES